MDLERVQEILARASELAPAERESLLAEACGEDAALRAEVERLLRSLDSAGAFLAAPVVRAVTEVLPPGWDKAFTPLGQTVGAYKLIDVLGRGGMGVVYLAERSDESYRRQVALKLLRDVAQGAALHRFLGERQILAALEHPNIARLYDGGETEDGRPFLVMEHVEGVPIDVYCRKRNLGVDDRIRLFRDVCGAVAYAHRNLLVHRDLKPSNILVTPEGVPKLLDFGIAMSLADGDRRATLPGEQPMTPAYASPEQVRGHAITTASDVYSLGVLLYELLTGRRPYQLEDDSDLTLQNAICEQEPARPSNAVQAGDQGDARRRRLRGDLDVIVLKALRKEPEHRYASVEALSDDLSRFLNYLPVLARQGAFTYRMRKFVQRNRWAVAAGIVVAAVLVAFLVALVRQTQLANRQSEVAGRERDRAERTLAAFVDAFKSSDPEQARGRELTAREILDQGAAKVRRELAGEPDLQATLLGAMGEVYVSLGRFDEAEVLLHEAHDLRREIGVDEGLSLYQLGELEYWRVDYQAAERYYRRALAAMLQGETILRGQVLRGLGLALVWLDQNDEGEAKLTEALVVLRGYFENGNAEILRGIEGLAWVARNRGDYAKAEKLFREVVAARRLGGPGPALGRSLADLGAIRYRQGALADARNTLEEALPMLRRSMGTDNSYIAEVLGKLVAVLIRLGDTDAAESTIHDILAILPADHPGAGTAFHNLGMILTDRGRLEEAKQAAREALRIKMEAFGESNENVAPSRCLLGRIALNAGDAGTAREHFQACGAVYPHEHPRLIFPWVGIGRSLQALEGCSAAVEWYRRAYNLGSKILGKKNPQTAQIARRLGACLRKLGQFKEAEELLARKPEDSEGAKTRYGRPTNH